MNTQPTTFVPAITDETTALLDDLMGFHPGIDLIVSGLRLLATGELDADQTQSVITVLGGNSYEHIDVLGAIKAVLLLLTDPVTNPGLWSLPADVQEQVQRLGLAWAMADGGAFPRALICETSAVIDSAA